MKHGFGSGWFFESRRHALASRGIHSKGQRTDVFTYQFPFDRHKVEEDKVRFNRWGNVEVIGKRFLKDTDGDGVPDKDDCRPFDPKKQDYELSPRYDSRASFYRKAMVRRENGRLILRSYDTDVAYIENGRAVVLDTYSATTLRHIKEFLKQEGFRADTSSQIVKDYPEHPAEPKPTPTPAPASDSKPPENWWE
jgi:hypothetical protein